MTECVDSQHVVYLGLFSNISPVVDKTGATPFDLVLDTLGNDTLFWVLTVRFVPMTKNPVISVSLFKFHSIVVSLPQKSSIAITK